MDSATQTATPPKRSWAGFILSGLAVAFLLFDSGIKFTASAPVAQAMNSLGFPVRLATAIGGLELVLLAIYLFPRTAVLGAVLWTGYLGGAIALHLRVGNPLFSHVLFPVYVALLLWGGLYFREDRLRQLLPLRS
jgi:hypothetical protein